MEEIEIWKSLDFLGYPDYQVSDFGNIKSLNYRCMGKERILKQRKIKNGYLYVTLCKNGKGKTFRVHQLIALTFIPNPNNLPQVNHKDENKQNNKLENLEWVSPKYNSNYGTRNERIAKANKGKKRSEETKLKISRTKKGKPNYQCRKPIQQYTKDMVFVREFDSATTASKELNINQGHITSCCNGKRKSAGEYIWRYKNVA